MYIIVIRMDIIKMRHMAFSEVAQVISGKKVVAGAKQLRKAVTSGKANQAFLASEADPAITEPIVALCQLHNVDVAWVKSMTDLGHACGIEVGAAMAAVLYPS